MAKDVKDKSKFLDRCLACLLESKMFESLILKIKALWHNDDFQAKQYTSEPQVSELAVQQSIVSQPQIIYKDKIVEKIVEVEVEKRVEVPVEKIVEKLIPTTPNWATDFEQQYQLWQILKDYPKLHHIFNQKDFANETHDVLTFVACASQWENILRVWEQLAEQCKESQTVASESELILLQNCIDLYNRILMGEKKAQLSSPKIGESYDYHIHHKLNDGESVKEILLPALSSPAKANVKLAIVLCN